jgi:hypothetical protein
MNTDDKKADAKNEAVATTTMAVGEPQAEGTTKAQPSKKGNKVKKTPVIDIEAEKVEVWVERVTKGEGMPLTGEEVSLSPELKAELETLRESFSSREGTKIDLADSDGQALEAFDLKHRNGRLGKMPNGKSTYRVIGEFNGFPVEAKQLRRIHDRWKRILEFRSRGITEPRLGVSHYDTVRPLKDPEVMLVALRAAEAEGLSVVELRKRFVPDGEKANKGWRESFLALAGRIIPRLREILNQMKEACETPGDDVLSMIEDIEDALDDIALAGKEETES